MSIFTGAGVAIITPFHADGSVNYEKLDELIQFHCDNGTDSIVICGTTGESSTLTEEEHMDCIKFTIQQTKGRIPVIAGTGSNCTRTAIEMSSEAAKSGADGVLLVTPYYNKATQSGLIAHYKAIAAETKGADHFVQCGKQNRSEYRTVYSGNTGKRNREHCGSKRSVRKYFTGSKDSATDRRQCRRIFRQ